jgi:hypothetical protein
MPRSASAADRREKDIRSVDGFKTGLTVDRSILTDEPVPMDAAR